MNANPSTPLHILAQQYQQHHATNPIYNTNKNNNQPSTIQDESNSSETLRHRANVTMHKRLDDADAAAGSHSQQLDEVETTSWIKSSPINATTELTTAPQSVIVLGIDISSLSHSTQFLTCAGGVFCFSLLYGYLQELIAVHLCNRQLGLFLAMAQFSGYTLWSFLLRDYVERRQPTSLKRKQSKIPLEMYVGVSLLRALDLSMTNLAMQFINYPAKTLLKSSRVCWIMLFGVLIARKKYPLRDYVVVVLMVCGLSLFMHADSKTSAIFQPLGVVMLMVSLMCDGVLTNLSEALMNKYSVGQDEYIFSLYSIALIFITLGAIVKGEFWTGFLFLFSNGTYDEYAAGVTSTSGWTVMGKLFVLGSFSTLGFFASSCSAAITKYFGALTMSITSTARKATTLFLSFALFPNKCTLEHVSGIAIFIFALLVKSLGKSFTTNPSSTKSTGKEHVDIDLEGDNEILDKDDSNNTLIPQHMRRISSGMSIV